MNCGTCQEYQRDEDHTELFGYCILYNKIVAKNNDCIIKQESL